MAGDLTVVCTASGQAEAVDVVQRCIVLLQSLDFTPWPDPADSSSSTSTIQFGADEDFPNEDLKALLADALGPKEATRDCENARPPVQRGLPSILPSWALDAQHLIVPNDQE